MRCLLIAVFWVLTGLPLSAQDTEIPNRMLSAFEGWAEQHNVQSAALVVRYKGVPMAEYGVDKDVVAPIEIASLSKAITGICLSELVREGQLSYSDRFNDLVGRGPDVSVAQLVTQTSGLKFDSTQGAMPQWLDMPEDQANAVLDQIIARDGPQEQPGKFRYNNENYALLSLAIAAASGTSYEAACRARALDPAGVTARQSPRSGAFLAWGGWHMSLDDYLRFMNHWFDEDLDPFAHPHVLVDGGAHYGLGVFFRAFRGGHNYWHYGGLCFPGRLNAGSFAVSWMGEWSAAVAYDTCPDWDAMRNLDAALSGAVFR